jgi:hypothetical protein
MDEVELVKMPLELLSRTRCIADQGDRGQLIQVNPGIISRMKPATVDIIQKNRLLI